MRRTASLAEGPIQTPLSASRMAANIGVSPTLASGIDGRRPDRTAQLAVVQSDQSHEGAGAQVGLAEDVGDRGDPVVGIDHPGERSVRVVQCTSDVHVPLAHDAVDRGRADVHLVARRSADGSGQGRRK